MSILVNKNTRVITQGMTGETGTFHTQHALAYGTPPHGGIAWGFDRLVMVMAGATSIREVIAFPKNNRGQDLMSHSPATVEPRQLRDLHIQTAAKAAPAP